MELSTSDHSRWLKPHPKLEGLSLMDHLFSRLNGMYPNKWAASFKSEQAIEDWKQAWAESFDEDGLTGADVKEGIRNCRRMYDWPPSISEFTKACRPYLTPDVAFTEAVKGITERNRGNRGNWSHPAIFWAAMRVGTYDLMNSGYAVLKGRWENALTDILAKGKWEPVPDAHVQLAAPGVTDADRAEAAKRMQELGATGILHPKRRDPKSWARRIIDKANGKGSVSAGVLAMAKRALGDEVGI